MTDEQTREDLHAEIWTLTDEDWGIKELEDGSIVDSEHNFLIMLPVSNLDD